MMYRDVQPIGARKVASPDDFERVLLDKRGPWVANRALWRGSTPAIDICTGDLMVARLRDSDGRCSSKMREYRRWLWARIKDRDAAVMDEMAKITEQHTLVCCCAPEPCSAEIVIMAWRWLRDTGKLR